MAKAGRDAPTVRREALARALESRAVELGRTAVKYGDTVLMLREAVDETGCLIGQPGRLVRKGKVPNAGRRGGPRIAWGDLHR